MPTSYSFVPSQPRCEYQNNPLGLIVASPRFSWILTPLTRNQRQTAYQVLVATSAEKLSEGVGDLWDSGKVISDQSIQVAYAGAPLTARLRAWWKVRAWDKDGAESGFSEPARFEIGLLSNSDWQAQWVSLPPQSGEINGPAPYLRREFSIGKSVKRARAYASALGLYKLYLNGKPVTEDCLLPGWTDYKKRVQYETFDVTRLINPGRNAAGIMLGDGWYCGPLGWSPTQRYGDYPEGLVQVEIEYEDGARETIVSDTSWKAATGPILTSTLYNGETYDARLEMPGWSAPGFDDHAWKPAQARPVGDVPLVASASPPVRKTEELPAKAVSEPTPGAYVFDLGQNMVGWARLKVAGRAGQEITLRFVEMLNPDGTVYVTNLRHAACTDRYILRGEGTEVYEPSFTFHGFRYMEITGLDSAPALETITGIVAHSDLPTAGEFECSNPLLNQLQKNIVWGQRGNFLEVPTDCPQRDERLGWMGDAQVFVRTGCFNMDAAGFYTKWVQDVVDAQWPEGGFPDVAPRIVDFSDGAPAWGDAGVIVPWVVYCCYGDRRILEENYAAMAKWVAYIADANPDHRWRNRRNNDFGDWLNIDAPTDKDLIATAYFAHDADLMARIARVLGKEDDARKFQALFGAVKESFNKDYVAADGRIKGETQTAYVLALGFDLLPGDKQALAAAHLARDVEQRGGLSTGFVGTGHLLPVLTRTGCTDLAYRLALSETFPSWGYSIRHGATTIWERWDGWTEEKGFQDPGMNSFNHYAFGAVGEWLYATVGGIDLDSSEPGYKHLIMKPHLGGGLAWARANYQSPYGEIASDWKIENGIFTWRIVVPVSSRATVYLPAADGQITEGGRPVTDEEGVRPISQDSGSAVFEIGSGEYRFEARLE